MEGEKDEKDFENEWEKQQREKEEANRQFTDLIWRVADALEHQSVEMTFGSLAMRGFVGDFGELKRIGHRVNCPSCVLAKTAKPMNQTPDGSRIIQPMGPSMRGLRLPKDG